MYEQELQWFHCKAKDKKLGRAYTMSKVMVNGKIYEIVEDPTTDIETVYSRGDALQEFPILAVTGTGRSVENGSLYEIVWHLDEQDASLLSDDASNWVSDWDTADDAVELEE